MEHGGGGTLLGRGGLAGHERQGDRNELELRWLYVTGAFEVPKKINAIGGSLARRLYSTDTACQATPSHH